MGAEKYFFRYTRHVKSENSKRPPGICIAGSGSPYLLRRRRKWGDQLRHLVKANDRGKISDLLVADFLVKLNYEAHLGTDDQSVGPRCIVAWRHRRGTKHKMAGATQFYTGTTRDSQVDNLPDIANGTDMVALISTMIPHVLEVFEKMRGGNTSATVDRDRINAELDRLPADPDDTLR